MTIFINIFADSAKEFKKIQSVTAAALLLAIHTVLACFVSIQVTGSLRISVSFLANCAIGYLFGPVMGFACGGIGDIIQFIIRPTGAYFPGWTLNAALAGFIYGCFFYGKKTGTVRQLKRFSLDISLLFRCIAAITLSTLLVNVLLGTYWCSVMYGKGFMFYFAARFTKNIIQLPVSIIMTYCLLNFMSGIRNKMM